MSDTEQHILAETGAAGPGNSIVDTLTGPQRQPRYWSPSGVRRRHGF
ncbi:hypothetical protein VXQ18_13830 [Brucella abortus]|nr:hypothetical protein [Brucella abortus]